MEKKELETMTLEEMMMQDLQEARENAPVKEHEPMSVFELQQAIAKAGRGDRQWGLMQAKEIATIKPRTFTIELSDADVIRLYQKAYSNGITPETLIKDYLGDLLCGTYSRGSDERMLANDYFDRCGYDSIPVSFGGWVLGMDYAESVSYWMQELEEAREELEAWEADLDDPHREWGLEKARGYVKEAEYKLNAIYQEYLEDGGKQTLKEGLEDFQRLIGEINGKLEEGKK